MDNVINQSTVINGEKSKTYIGKKFDGYIASGYSVFIGCSGTVQIPMEEAKLFTLINCPNLIVENPYGNNVPVIRDGYAIGDYLFTANANPAAKYGGYWEEVPNGTFLMAAGAGGTVDQTGGSADAVVVSHGHQFATSGSALALYVSDSASEASQGFQSAPAGSGLWADVNKASSPISNTGEDGTGKNLPPYRTAHIFKRIKDPTTGNL